MDASPNWTRILADICAHRTGADVELLPLLYAELHRMAEAQLQGERRGHTLQPTALVHEAYLRVFGADDVDWENRAHFFGAVGQAMRRVLVEHARRRNAVKRGGDRMRVTLDDALDFSADRNEEVLAVHDALDRLADIDERKARLVELRFFCGLGAADAARALGVSERTGEREWSFARAWLFRELGRP